MSRDEKFVIEEKMDVSFPAPRLPAAQNASKNGGHAEHNASSNGEGGLDAILPFVHSFRRHWLAASALGSLCAVIASLVVWVVMPARFTATAFLQISLSDESLLGQNRTYVNEQEFTIRKSTQLGIIQSPFVLLRALGRDEIKSLPVVKEQADPLAWLTGKISVSFPNKAEIMQVSLTTDGAKQSADIVTAVVEEYYQEVVERERKKKENQLSKLQTVYGEKDNELRKKRNELKSLAENLGAAESETLNLKQRLVLEELTTFRQEWVRSQSDLGRLKNELAAQKALLAAAQNMTPTPTECQQYAANDPKLKLLAEDIAYQEMNQQSAKDVIAPGTKSTFANQAMSQSNRTVEQYNRRLGEIAEEIVSKRTADVQKDIDRLEAAIAGSEGQSDQMQKAVRQLSDLANKFGTVSIDVEMKRSDIKNTEIALTEIANEQEKLKVDLRAPSRVSILQPAEPPQSESGRTARMMLALLSGIASFCLPVAFIVWVDSTARRVNSAKDVSNKMDIPVLGTVPRLPAQVMKNKGSAKKKYQSWQFRLTESVDGIAARILRRGETDQRRVIMVSSAKTGEGKTTIAAQLAMSLARAKRKTLLIDFDLRQPSFDGIFGLERSPGVCEVLRGECETNDVVQTSPLENLFLMTAGCWDRFTSACLSNSAPIALFKEVREDYDFIIVDTGPILPIADTRFVSQYVDSVVLSVFRDVSQAEYVREACDILEAFGVRSIEAVVTGVNEKIDRRQLGYIRPQVTA